MSTTPLLDGWPAGSAASLLALEDGVITTVATEGDPSKIFDWASVSKLAVALAVGVEHDWRYINFDQPVGPANSTVAHLLSHSSGLGLDASAPTQPVGQRRVYTTYGYDVLIERIVSSRPPIEWLRDRCLSAIGMNDVTADGSLGAGLSGSLHSLEQLATAWLRGDLLTPATFQRMTSVHLPDIGGVVPGFGSFTPCPWGLGPEIKGTKDHWMGSAWPAASYGHFGKSGSLVLIDPVAKVAVVALSAEPFGPWATALWPTWTNEVHTRLVNR